MTIEYKDSKRIITYPSVDAYWDFDGSDYVDLGNTILSGTGAFSSMAVIKVDSAGSGSRDIWSNYRSSATGGNQLYVLSTNKVSYYQGSGNTSHTAGTALTDDTWYNVIIVNDGSTSTIYINGTSDGATSQSASVSGSNMQIGGLDSSGTFDGGIADVAFWSRALTTAEITALQSDPNPSNLSSTSNLISYYNFEQTSGNLIDQVGSNNGTNNGATQTGTRNVAQAKPTDVQDNSILVEKDTAKRYWRTGASGLTEEQQLSNAELQDLNIGAKGMGEYVRSTSSKLYGKILTNIQFYLKKGTPEAGAKVYARHYSSSDILIHTYWEKLASDLPTSLTWTTETTLSGDTAFANGDYFVIEYTKTDGTSASGSVSTNRKDNTNANQWDGSNSGYINTYFGSSSYLDTGNMDIWFKGTTATPATWTYPPDIGQIAQLSGSDSANSYTAASEFYTISTDVWDSAFNLSGGGRARAGSAGSTEHAYLLGGQDGSSGYYTTIDKVAWADKTNTTISRSARAWGSTVQNAVSVCVGQSYYIGSYQTGINEYTYGTMAETSQGNTSSSHAFGGSFGNSTYGFVINGQNTGIERYTYSDKSKTSSGFTASPTTTNSGGHTGNSTTGISINNTAGSGNARYDSYNISADTWTTGSATSSTPYENGRASGSTKYDLFSTQTNTGTARQCEKYNYSSGALSSFTSVATNLDGGDQDAGASSTNTGVNS